MNDNDLSDKCAKIALAMGDSFQAGIASFEEEEFQNEAIKIIITIIACLETALIEGLARTIPAEDRLDFCQTIIQAIMARSLHAIDNFYKKQEMH